MFYNLEVNWYPMGKIIWYIGILLPPPLPFTGLEQLPVVQFDRQHERQFLVCIQLENCISLSAHQATMHKYVFVYIFVLYRWPFLVPI